VQLGALALVDRQVWVQLLELVPALKVRVPV